MFFIDKIVSNDRERTSKLTLIVFVWCVMILSRCIGFLNIDQYILMGVCIVSLLFTTYKECKYLLFFLLPLSCCLQAFTISFGIIILYLKSPKKTFGYFGALLILLILEFIHLIGAPSISIIDFVYYSTYLFTFFYLISDGDCISSPRFCTKMFCYGLMIALFVVIYGMISTFGIDGAFSGIYRDGSIIGEAHEEGAVGVSLNANSVAYYSLALLSIILWNPSKLQISRFFIIIGIIIAVTAGVISFSRTWVILLSLFALLLFALTSHKKYFLTTLIAVLLIIPSFSHFTSVTEGFSQRFQSEDIQTAGNRKGISMQLLDYMTSSPSTLVGGAGVLTYEHYTHQRVSPHNASQQILVCTGLLGFFIFAITIYRFIRTCFIKSRSWISLLPFFICFLEIQTIQFLSPHFLMFPIIGTLYCMKLENNSHG